MQGRLPIGEGPQSHEPGQLAEEQLDFQIASGSFRNEMPIGEGGSSSPVPEDYDGDFLANEDEFPASAELG